MNSIHTIVFIGAGNVATHLADAFKDTGRNILQVYSRSEGSAETFADKIGIAYTTDLEKIAKDADLYIISVSDSALPEVSKKLKIAKGLVVHTSGFHSINIITKVSKNIGVFYPLQTFSKNKSVDFLSIPVCVEGNSEENIQLLEDLARSFSTDVRYINSAQRKKIHLAAVFACNFTNHMYQLAEEILKSENIPFDILKPLIKETAEKVIKLGPFESQTGPARRSDITVMKQHLKMLDDKDFRELYKKISNMINKKYST